MDLDDYDESTNIDIRKVNIIESVKEPDVIDDFLKETEQGQNNDNFNALDVLTSNEDIETIKMFDSTV